jgi:L-histidine N-alpha-methyltransferase
MLDAATAESLRAGLASTPPEISSKYLYDDHGSELFEKITYLPEYYQTRTEIGILGERADDIIAAGRTHELVELGSGAGRKIRFLLEALVRKNANPKLTLFEINELFLTQSADKIRADFPQVEVRGVVGDLTTDMERVGRGDGRMFIIFGGTFGNFPPGKGDGFLKSLVAQMGENDTLLLGADIVKDPAILEAAYNDSQGVTAEFNLNTLNGFNALTGANFDTGNFEHRAFFDTDHEWIEMRLRATAPNTVTVPALDMTLDFKPGDEIRTEYSCKYTRESLGRRVAAAGLGVDDWFADADNRFALALLRLRTD